MGVERVQGGLSEYKLVVDVQGEVSEDKVGVEGITG